MHKRTVKIEIDPQNPPRLSDEARAHLERLAATPDEAIDDSDIPPLSDDFWARAVRNPFYKPRKADVEGPGIPNPPERLLTECDAGRLAEKALTPPLKRRPR